MPAYNVDRYIARALSSIQNQTLEDIEILVVDDGSSDRSGSIADKLAERDLRIDVYHTQNAGAAAARNLALDHAKGDYVFFCDADDWIENNMLEDMLALCETHNLELAICGFHIETYYGADGEFLDEIKACPDHIYASQQEFRDEAYQLFDTNMFYTPWNKLFERKRIEELGLRFRDTFMDDFPFVLDYIRDVECVGIVEHAYYHFMRSRAESETSKWRPNLYEKREDEHQWMLDLIEHWGLASEPKTVEMVQRRYIERLIGCIENVCNKSCTLNRKEKIASIRNMITTDHAQLAARVAQPKSRMMAVMLAPIKAKNAHLTYMEGQLISRVKTNNTKLFATLKSRR